LSSDHPRVNKIGSNCTANSTRAKSSKIRCADGRAFRKCPEMDLGVQIRTAYCPIRRAREVPLRESSNRRPPAGKLCSLAKFDLREAIAFLTGSAYTSGKGGWTGLPGLRCDFSSDSLSENQGSQHRGLSRVASSYKAATWRAAGLAPVNLLRNAGHALSCAFLPSCCALCGTFVPRLSNTPICDACWGEVAAQRENCCVRCGEDLFMPAAEPNHCRACRMVPPAFLRAVSYGVYEGAMRGAIHALKYDRMAPLGRELGRRLATAIAGLAGEDTSAEMLVVPVPLHRSRQAQRGFNQARELAGEALRVLRRTHPEWRLELSPRALVRKRSTESQAGLTPPPAPRESARRFFCVRRRNGARTAHSAGG